MKKTTLFISSLVLSSILVFGQSSRKAAPITKSTHINAIDDQRSFEVIQNAKRTPSGHIRCVTTEMEDLQREANPNLKSKEEYSEWLEQLIKNNQNNNSTNKASRNIPVVVHVIHNGDALGSGENISDAQVMSQITVLNADFSATNSDFNSTSYFNSVKTNMDIQFCLAKTDPNGQPTTGINRVNYGTASFGQSATQAMKAATQWDPTKYFNIWVVRFGGDLNGVLGYAQFPNSGAANTDGVVIGYNYFGTTGAVSAPYNKGRTATHEVGHCFGLYHIWGDESACAADDNVADTPQQKGENYGCPSYPQTTQSGGRCSTSDPSSMYMNYMDYTDDACMYMFTAGQKARVDAVLASAPRRASLLTSTVCNVAAINADFTGNPLVINEGQTVTFTSTSSSPATLNSWNWTFTGGVPGSFNGQTPPAITYSTAGTYAVSLTVTDNAAGTDTETKTAYITVNAAGTVTCDSTVAGWDWNTESFGGAYWTQDAAACNLPLEGYIVGNNCYDDNGWASKITSPAGAKELVEVRYVFVQSTGTGGAKLKIWNANGAGGKPSTVLASTAITTGQFSGNLNQFISVPISPAIPMSATAGAFFIGYDHDVTPLNGDTIVMGVANATTNNTWANESGGGWLDLSAYSVLYKGTVVAIVCDIATGVQSHLADLQSIVAYPNPTTGIVEVMLPKNNGTVKVYNMIGEEVTNASTTSNMMKVDLSNQPNGIYFVKVSSNGEVTTKKVILSK
ncbi:MAG: T9SS type A sorting domain-containing protein [Flavobacteriales bacterium]|nr:T9SS type A sorting domain-containing protein [Flavobacteriales bacterium]